MSSVLRHRQDTREGQTTAEAERSGASTNQGIPRFSAATKRPGILTTPELPKGPASADFRHPCS